MAGRKKKVEPVTVGELKSYVKSAMDLNEDGWHPDEKQWKKILEMIMNVKEPEPVAAPPAAVAPHYGPPPPAPALPGQPPPAPPMGMGEAPPNPYELNPAEAPSDRPPPMIVNTGGAPVPKFLRTGPESAPDENGVISSGITVKTPNIDTSQGYKSGYE